eukprot:scaffold5103_cov350-Prasinococcus_capsulatus_cf.AAC.1
MGRRGRGARAQAPAHGVRSSCHRTCCCDARRSVSMRTAQNITSGNALSPSRHGRRPRHALRYDTAERAAAATSEDMCVYIYARHAHHTYAARRPQARTRALARPISERCASARLPPKPKPKLRAGDGGATLLLLRAAWSGASGCMCGRFVAVRGAAGAALLCTDAHRKVHT